MTSFLNLSMKTKLDKVKPIIEEPEEYSEQPYVEQHDEPPQQYEDVQPTFNIDAFVDHDDDVFRGQKIV